MSFGLLAAALLGATGVAEAAHGPCAVPFVGPIDGDTCTSDGLGMGALPEGLYLGSDHGELWYDIEFEDVQGYDVLVELKVFDDQASGDAGHWTASVFRHESGGLKFAVAGNAEDNPVLELKITVMDPGGDVEMIFVDLDGGHPTVLQEVLTYRSEYLKDAAVYLAEGGQVTFELSNLLPAGPSGRFSGGALIGNPNPSSPIADPPEDTIKGVASATFGNDGAEFTVEGQWGISKLSTGEYIEGGFYLFLGEFEGLEGICPVRERIEELTCDP